MAHQWPIWVEQGPERHGETAAFYFGVGYHDGTDSRGYLPKTRVYILSGAGPWNSWGRFTHAFEYSPAKTNIDLCAPVLPRHSQSHASVDTLGWPGVCLLPGWFVWNSRHRLLIYNEAEDPTVSPFPGLISLRDGGVLFPKTILFIFSKEHS